MTTNRRLAAIMVADVVGYSRLMEADEAGTLDALKERRKAVLEPILKGHGGRIVKVMGDGVLVEFASAVKAVEAAIELQNEMAAANEGSAEGRAIMLRIGINIGDVIGEGSDIYGDGVNIAARLEGIASPGGVVVAAAARDQIGNRLNVQFEDLGEVQLKNISRPIHAWAISSEPSRSKPDRGKDNRLTSIAVLPFNNMSGDPEQDYFADGIAEDVLTELSRHRDLAVVSRNSSFAYKGKAVNIQTAGRELNADFILEGSVRKAGSRVRITAQLIDSTTGNHVWAERYDRSLDDIFALQDEIVSAILRGFTFNLPRAAARQRVKDPTASTNAYTAFLQARAAWRASDEKSTFIHLGRALELDSNYAMALAFMAHLLSYSQFSGTSSNNARNDKQLSQDYAARALALDAQDPVVLVHVAVAKWMTGETASARTLIETAREIMPRDPYVIQNQGQILVYCGEHHRGIALMEESVHLETRLPTPTKMGMAEGYYLAKDYRRALHIYDSILDIPWYAAIGRAACLAQLGQIDDAKRVTETAQAMAPPTIDTSEFAHNLAAMCVLKDDADNWLEGFRKMGFCK